MTNNNTLIEYYATITFSLAVGYFLFITNPPSNLQVVENGVQIYKQLSNFADIQANGFSIAVFLSFFCVLSFFIGLLLSSVYERVNHTLAHLVPSFVVIIMLAWIVYPYYGKLVAFEALPFGFFGWYLGLFYSPKFRSGIRKYWFSHIPAIVMSGFLAIIFVGFLIKVFSLLDYFLIFISGLIMSVVLIYATIILKLFEFLKKRLSKD